MIDTYTMAALRDAVDATDRPEESDYASDVRLVQNSTELNKVYKDLAAGKGGIIELASSAAPFSLDANDFIGQQIDAPVLIRSADPDNRAVMESANIKARENLAIQNVEFYAERGANGENGRIVAIYDSKNIGIYDSEMHSNATGPVGVQDGSDSASEKGSNAGTVRGSDNITIAGNKIYDVQHAFSFLDSGSITITHNEITQAQGDGLRLGGVQNIEINGNWMHDMYGSTKEANHSDMIQFWGTNIEQNTKNVTISDNVLDNGTGPAYHLIFGRNEYYGKNGWLYEDIVVENNVLVGGGYHLISISETQDMVVRDNTLISSDDNYVLGADGSRGEIGEGWIFIGGNNGTIKDNIAARILNDSSGNAMIKPDAQSDHFVNLEAGASGDLRDIMLRPDSALNGAYGSDLLWTEGSSSEILAVASTEVSKTDQSVVSLDAGYSRYKNGFLDEGDAAFQWTFSDGTKAQGLSVEHDFGTSGSYDYTLRVLHDDGSVDQIERSLEIAPSAHFDFEIKNGTITNTADGSASFMNASDVKTSGDAIVIADGQVPQISRDSDGIFSLESFDFEMTVDPDPGSSGTFLLIHKAMHAKVLKDGSVSFSFSTEDGTFKATTEPGLFDDGAHHLNFVYDGAAETFSILADGENVAEVSASGTTLPASYWGLNFGNPWGSTLDAEISDIRLAQESGTTQGGPQAVMDSMDAPQFEEEAPQEPAYPLPEAPVNDADTSDDGLVFAEVSSSAAIPGGVVLKRENGDGAFQLGEDTLYFDRSNDWIYNATSFEISFDATLDDPGTSGTILHLNKTLSLDLDEAGHLVFSLTTDEGSETITTASQPFADGGTHRIGVGYDDGAGTMQITVDGVVEASGAHGGATPDVLYWSLNFGHTWDGDTPDMRVDKIAASGFSADGSVVNPSDDGTNPESASGVLIDLDFDGDLEDAAGDAEARESRGSVSFATEGNAKVGVFDGDTALSFSRDLDFLFSRDSFEFDLRIGTGADTDQRVLNLHRSLSLSIEEDDFVFRMTTDEGEFEVRSDSDVMADDALHGVEVGYSDTAGVLALRVDGVIVDSVAAGGTTAPVEYWGLDIGRSWSGDLEARIDHFTMSDEASWNLLA